MAAGAHSSLARPSCGDRIPLGSVRALTIAVPAVSIGAAWSLLSLVRTRRLRDRASIARTMRYVILVWSFAASLILMELAVWLVSQRSYRIPVPQTLSTASSNRLEQQPGLEGSSGRDPRASANSSLKASGDSSLYFVVLGESMRTRRAV